MAERVWQRCSIVLIAAAFALAAYAGYESNQVDLRFEVLDELSAADAGRLTELDCVLNRGTRMAMVPLKCPDYLTNR